MNIYDIQNLDASIGNLSGPPLAHLRRTRQLRGRLRSSGLRRVKVSVSFAVWRGRKARRRGQESQHGMWEAGLLTTADVGCLVAARS